MTEYELTQNTLSWIIENFENWKFEQPLHRSMIDFIGLRKDGKLIAIEYKLRAWKKAIQQAIKHKNAVDYSYILIPKMQAKTLDKIKKHAQKNEIGIYLYNTKLKETIEFVEGKKQDAVRWIPNYNNLIKSIKEV